MNTDKKQRIMQAAEGLFRTRQFDEITLDEVARQADVGKGTLYLYFADKEDLFFQTAVSGFDEMCALLPESATAGMDFRQALLRTSQGISDFFRARRPLFRMILTQGDRALGRGGSLRERWLTRRKTLTEAVAEIIARGVAAGEVRTDIPPKVMAEYLLGILRTRAMEMDEVPEIERSHAALVDLFVNGASCPAPQKHPTLNSAR